MAIICRYLVPEFMYSKEDDLSPKGNAHHRVFTSMQILPSFQGLKRASDGGGRDDLHSAGRVNLISRPLLSQDNLSAHKNIP